MDIEILQRLVNELRSAEDKEDIERMQTAVRKARYFLDDYEKRIEVYQAIQHKLPIEPGILL